GTAGTTRRYAYRLTRDGGATWLYGDLGTAGSSDGFTTPGTLQIASLYFSEYIEGGGNNKAIEIYNAGSTTASLAGCSVRVWPNANTAPNPVLAFTTETIAAGAVLTVCNTIAGCTKTTGNANWNGNDTVELFCGGAIIDSIGKESENPAASWGTDPITTVDHTLLRRCDVFAGDPIGTDTFDPAVQWASYAKDTFVYLGARNCPLP
ncbi:MAG: lamin tail domain-containing protein, partial [Kofleriaceae bacterium]